MQNKCTSCEMIGFHDPECSYHPSHTQMPEYYCPQCGELVPADRAEAHGGNNMVERVARAQDPAIWVAVDANDPDPKEAVAVKNLRNVSLSRARFAILAMREPSHNMLTAVHDELDAFGHAKTDYQTMIDAALKGPPDVL